MKNLIYILMCTLILGLLGCLPVKPINTKQLHCDEDNSYSGGVSGGNYTVDLKSNAGEFDFRYSTYTVADQFKIFYEGKILADTGCTSTGGTSNSPIFNTTPIRYSGNSNFVNIKANGNCARNKDGNQTEWQFKVGCIKIAEAALVTDPEAKTTTLYVKKGNKWWVHTQIPTIVLVIPSKGALPNPEGGFSTKDVDYVDSPQANVRSFGPAGSYIDTHDSRERDIHGGGSGLSTFANPRQGWYCTHGCTRGQNEDVKRLGRAIDEIKKKHKIKIPYQRFDGGIQVATCKPSEQDVTPIPDDWMALDRWIADKGYAGGKKCIKRPKMP